ncbi:MAG TPA: ABC transporter permease [Lachnospiraceae bacterium]|nr:ABC transporter permease [Lachnospiraceae bacterium]HCA70900.1 ABC transporter permease [Lachnospiraceae bacterium]HCM11846.1 ABC transporter permease [Lachnospiraceae bacterium]HCR41293.1 ABC transporter permease [Lachnospiraceae bacterium]
MKSITINPKGFHKSQIKFYIILVPLALFMALPIVYIVNHAFKPLGELFAFPPKFFAVNPTLDNFTKLGQTTQTSTIALSRYIFNSLVVTLAVVTITVIIGSMAGFAISKLQFKGRTLFFEINTLSMMFVPAAVLIPRYLIIDKLHIMDTYLAHILPLLAMPVGMFLLKQFIDDVPYELIEAAVVDGAGMFKVYYKVILPLIKPAIATVCILSFQQVWGNLETSNMFITKESMKTLAFFMSTLVNANNNVAGQGVAAAGGLIMFIPNIILFILLQSKVMNTMSHSGIK